jgi:Holliday junction resolvase RusA-like endonuclease
MTEVAFFVPGEPVAKARPRATVVNGRPRIYTPAKSVSYERAVGLIAKRAMRGRRKLAGALGVEVEFLMPIPKSWPKARRLAALHGGVAHEGKPDIDNLVKSVVDGMNGIVFKDDAGITKLAASKTYCPLGEGGCRVKVTGTE